MESIGLPMREIRKRYTLSEIYIMGWRSKEMSQNMRRDRKGLRSIPPASGPTPVAHGKRVRVEETDEAYILPEDVNNGVALPKTFFNKEGELDLSLQTGPAAVRYLQAIGLNVPTYRK